MTRNFWFGCVAALFTFTWTAVGLDFIPDQSFLPSTGQGPTYSDNVPYYSPIGELFTASAASLNIVAFDIQSYEQTLPETLAVEIFEGGVSGSLIAVSDPVLIPSGYNLTAQQMTDFHFSLSVSLTPGTVYFLSLVQFDHDLSNPIFLWGAPDYPLDGGIRNGSLYGADYYFAEGTAPVPEPTETQLLICILTVFVFRGALTGRWSERRTAVRSTFKMTTSLPLRSMRGLARRRSSFSR
jgi:hypothetical protein